jgi:hypothetical protein
MGARENCASNASHRIADEDHGDAIDSTICQAKGGARARNSA